MVLSDAHAEARRTGVLASIRFNLRESAGLIAGIVREHRHKPECQKWIAPLECSFVVLILYCAFIRALTELGLHGFYFPGSYLLAGLLCTAGAWLAGGSKRVLAKWKPAARLAVVAAVFLLLAPLVLKASETAWLRVVAERQIEYDYRIPGINVSAHHSESPDATPLLGLTFSTPLRLTDGRYILMIWRRSPTGMHYSVPAAFMVMAIAFWSRRRPTPVSSPNELGTS